MGVLYVLCANVLCFFFRSACAPCRLPLVSGVLRWENTTLKLGYRSNEWHFFSLSEFPSCYIAEKRWLWLLQQQTFHSVDFIYNTDLLPPLLSREP